MPKHCFLCMQRAPYGGTVRAPTEDEVHRLNILPPTVRVNGLYQFMHVCDGHETEARRIVGDPNVITRLTGPWITSEDMERENELLSHGS